MTKRISVSFKNEDKNLLSRIIKIKESTKRTYSDIIKNIMKHGVHGNNTDKIQKYLDKFDITEDKAIKILYHHRVHQEQARKAGVKLNKGHQVNKIQLKKAIREACTPNDYKKVNKSAIIKKYHVSRPAFYRELKKYRARQNKKH